MTTRHFCDPAEREGCEHMAEVKRELNKTKEALQQAVKIVEMQAALIQDYANHTIETGNRLDNLIALQRVALAGRK